jgi:[acyl-carrier-protein] S-malonyltransferase
LLWRGQQAPDQHRSLDEILKELGLEIAIHRPGDELVIGGSAAALDAFLALPEIANAQWVRLPVSLPSHTSWLRSALRPWAEVLDNSALADAQIPVVAGIDGRTIRQRAAAISALSRQIAEPLRWDWISEDLAALEADVYLELGPDNDLSKQLQAMLPNSRSRSADEFSTPTAAIQWILAGQQ